MKNTKYKYDFIIIGVDSAGSSVGSLMKGAGFKELMSKNKQTD